ncbi:MAG: phosphatidylglycerophosphatase A [Verrucomicrobiota bacterium]
MPPTHPHASSLSPQSPTESIPMMTRLTCWIAACFGLGYLPKAPGTWGTLLGYPIWLGLSLLPYQDLLPARLLTAGLLALIAVPICWIAERAVAEIDPGWVVLDEAIAIPFCLLLYRPTGGSLLLLLPLSFALFRLFDILKPPPIFQIQRLPGGWGVVLDDVLAGLYTAFALWLLKWIGVPGL